MFLSFDTRIFRNFNIYFVKIKNVHRLSRVSNEHALTVEYIQMYTKKIAIRKNVLESIKQVFIRIQHTGKERNVFYFY